MAALRQATEAVALLETELALLRDAEEAQEEETSVDWERVENAVTSVITVLRASGRASLPQSIELFRHRMTQVDPVTQTPRFGPKTMASVVELLRRFDAVQEQVEKPESVLVSVQRKMKGRKERAEREKQMEAQRLREEEEKEREREEALKVLQLQREEEEKRREQEMEIKRRNEVATLAAQKRQEREQAQREQQRMVEKKARELREWNAGGVCSREGVLEAVAALREHIGSPMVFRNAVDKMLAILENICTAPENEAYRRIPKANAHFHEDLGQYTGAYECLRAMGFRHLEPEVGHIVFSMEEPDLSADLDAWSNWFDQLKAMKEALEEMLIGVE